MSVCRRSFIKSAIFGALAVSWPSFAVGQNQIRRELPRPDPSQFQSGDLVWPKKPKAYVPYNSGSGNSLDQDKDHWIKERDEYLEKNKITKLSKIEQERVQALRGMDYREFLAIYAGGQDPGVPGAYSGGSVYVGHVGIIEVDSDKTAWVVEALLDKGVVRSTYSDWIASRSEDVVWVGRLRQLDMANRAKIAQEAIHYLKKPYRFWNFNLNDDSGFYCSKLVWLSIYRSLGFAIDGNEEPERKFWFSPKQLLYLPTIDRIHDPGPYATS